MTLLTIYPDHGKQLLRFLSECDRSSLRCTCKTLSKKIYVFVQTRLVTLQSRITQKILSGIIEPSSSATKLEEIYVVEYNLKIHSKTIGSIKLHLPHKKKIDHLVVYQITNFRSGTIAHVGTELIKTAIRESFNRGLNGKVELYPSDDAIPFYWKLGFLLKDDKPLGVKYPQLAKITSALLQWRHQLSHSPKISEAIGILTREQTENNKPPGIIDDAYVTAHWYWDLNTQPQSTATRTDLLRLLLDNIPLPPHCRHWGKAKVHELCGVMYLPKERIKFYEKQLDQE